MIHERKGIKGFWLFTAAKESTVTIVLLIIMWVEGDSYFLCPENSKIFELSLHELVGTRHRARGGDALLSLGSRCSPSPANTSPLPMRHPIHEISHDHVEHGWHSLGPNRTPTPSRAMTNPNQEKRRKSWPTESGVKSAENNATELLIRTFLDWLYHEWWRWWPWRSHSPTHLSTETIFNTTQKGLWASNFSQCSDWVRWSLNSVTRFNVT